MLISTSIKIINTIVLKRPYTLNTIKFNKKCYTRTPPIVVPRHFLFIVRPVCTTCGKTSIGMFSGKAATLYKTLLEASGAAYKEAYIFNALKKPLCEHCFEYYTNIKNP